MIRLGLRLALAGGRGAVAGLALTATAVAVGTAVLLFALSFAPAVGERDSRTAWRDTYIQAAEGASGTFMAVFDDRTEGELLTRVHLAPSGDGNAPIPPGIAAMPGPGEAYVSPSLAARIAALPPDQLADRIGRVVGTIDDRALASPDELVAVIGTEPDVLRAYGATVVSGYATEAAALALPPIGALIVVLAGIGAMAPVAVFVATATRMSAARRELRLAALRLVGATPAQVARLAVVEALIATSVGAVVGVVLFFAVRPLIARIPLDETTWWPASIVPPLLPALGLLVLVQVAGAAGALVTMRRLTIGPLGVQRRTVPPAPGARRVVPLALSVVVLMVAISQYRAGDLPELLTLGMAGLAFGGVIGGIAFAGPWLTGVVGRVMHRSARGGASLLAARRLGDDPRGSFGAIAGVIMAVFVASAFFTFTAYTRTQTINAVDPLLRPNAIVAWLSNGSGLSTELADRLAHIDGVTAAVPIREVGLFRGDGFEAFAWVASCPDVVAVLGLDGAACPPGGIGTLSASKASGRYTLFPDRTDPTGATPPQAEVDLGVASPPLVAAGIGPDLEGLLPQLIIDPSALDDPSAAEAFQVTRIHVTTDGTPGVADRVRSAVVAAAPAAYVRVQGMPFGGGPFEEIGRIVAIGLLGTLGLAGCSLAVAVTTATLERRRQFVFLRSAGMSAASLRATILLQAGVPLVAVAAASALLGAAVGIAVISIAGGTVALPDVSVIGILGASVAVAMLIVALTLPPLERMTRPSSLRHE